MTWQPSGRALGVVARRPRFSRAAGFNVSRSDAITVTIAATPAKLHWNYFLALERDMESASRYIEFCEANFSIFSIELAHLLFAAASEVDVVAKLLCKQIAPGASPKNINDYK